MRRSLADSMRLSQDTSSPQLKEWHRGCSRFLPLKWVCDLHKAAAGHTPFSCGPFALSAGTWARGSLGAGNAAPETNQLLPALPEPPERRQHVHRAHNTLDAQHPPCSRNKETPNFSLLPRLALSCLEVQLSRLCPSLPQLLLAPTSGLRG